MFKLCVVFALLAVAFTAPAPKPVPAPKPKPYYYATAYTYPGFASPVLTYSADLAAPVVYADEYYDPGAYYAYAAAPLVVV